MACVHAVLAQLFASQTISPVSQLSVDVAANVAQLHLVTKFRTKNLTAVSAGHLTWPDM